MGYILKNFRYEQPDFRPIKESGKLYRVHADAIFKWDRFAAIKMSTFKLVVPEGFLTNGLSASRVAAIFGLGRDGIHRAAVCVHDFIYFNSGSLSDGSLKILNKKSGEWEKYNGNIDRKQADDLLRALLKDAGVKSWHVFSAYWLARIFGGLFWEERSVGK